MVYCTGAMRDQVRRALCRAAVQTSGEKGRSGPTYTCSMYVSFPLHQDCTLHVTTSLCPLPMINLATMDQDWYEGITHKLKWCAAVDISQPRSCGVFK